MAQARTKLHYSPQPFNQTLCIGVIQTQFQQLTKVVTYIRQKLNVNFLEKG